MIKPLKEPSIHLGAPGEDIGRQDLQTIKHRFKRLNRLREQRVQDFLQPRQQVFLDLLPLLFHYNFPMLPGFISSSTPAGIPEYSPGNQAIKAARQLVKNFDYTRLPLHIYPIEGLFLMGSVGSIAFSKTSDMDIWLCHQIPPLLKEGQGGFDGINELQQKATAIELWAASLGLEVHFFLIDSQQFRLGQNAPISIESSGQTQHYLLLEEFYRTAIYIAGKSPAWWLVPPHQERNYTIYIKHLIDNLFIPKQELIDLGGFDAVPAEEFIGATLWHLYKSLHTPHKSLLKLLLMECYASEYPKTQYLCQDIKTAIYQGSFLTLDLDPYFLIYQKVEKYLQKNNSHDRLAMVRQSFYLKVLGSSCITMDASTRATREQYMQTIAKQWHWPASTIDELKHLRSWNIKKATSEHAVILQQLTHCYRMIMGFARDFVAPNQQNSNDLKLIGRKLHSFLEKKPGKIEIITTRSEVHTKEAVLFIVENSLSDDGWALHLKSISLHSNIDIEPIQKCRHLIEILCWLVINGLYHKQLQLYLSSYSLKMSNEELNLTLKKINLFLIQRLDYDPPLTVYQSAQIPLSSLILINMGISDNEELCVMSERSDLLSYGKNRQCFIQTINRISLSSWSEITTSQEIGIAGLFNCFVDIINNKTPLTLSKLTFVCHTPTRAAGIILRVEAVYSTVVNLFSKQQVSNCSLRYILAAGTSFYVFQIHNKTLGYKELSTKKRLLNELARPQEQFSTVHFEPSVLENTPVHLIYSLNKPQAIQLFYYASKLEITVYIVDEKGALYIQQHSNANARHLLNQYSVFLESILSRNLFEELLTIEYYEIKKSVDGKFSHQPVPLKATRSIYELNLRITGEDSLNGIHYTIYCNEQEFSSLDHGNQVFYAAYQHILQFRGGRMDYPVHITDIDLPLSVFRVDSSEQLQMIYYLNYKQKIEDKFNV